MEIHIDYDLARQYARAGSSLVRRLYASANWRKLRREELGTYRDADGEFPNVHGLLGNIYCMAR